MKEPSKIRLNNPKAQKLLEQKKIIINGLEVHLWTGHNCETVNIQQKWNKLISLAELNEQTTGENGAVVFTGVMQIPRHEVAQYAVKLGFNVRNSVSQNINYIVFGAENVSPSKVAKAIEINQKGGDIVFIDENTFLELVLENYDLIEEEPNHNDVTVIEFIKSEKENESRYAKAEKEIDVISDKLGGKSFVISGVFEKYSRDELKDMIIENGGKNTGSISAKTDFVLAGDKMGPSKLEKARKLGVKIISEDEFLGMIGVK
jgi:NAD-dependent DNA ligase